MTPEKLWRARFSDDSIKFLKKLDIKTSNKLLDKIEKIEQLVNPSSSNQVKRLTGKLRDYYRLRVGNYRIIFELDTANNLIGILQIVTRKDAYK